MHEKMLLSIINCPQLRLILLIGCKCTDTYFKRHIAHHLLNVADSPSDPACPSMRLRSWRSRSAWKKATPSADGDHRIGPLNISPLDWQCAQPALCVQIRHAVPAPVVAHGNGFEGLAPQWMKGMRHGKNLRATIATICNGRFSIRGRSRAAWALCRRHR
jgi:hypothetical protein